VETYPSGAEQAAEKRCTGQEGKISGTKEPAEKVANHLIRSQPPGLKPRILLPERLSGFENPLPGLKSGAGTRDESFSAACKARRILNRLRHD
jgi:hypothetical protein